MKKNRVFIVSEPGVDGVFRHVEGLVDFLCDSGVTVDLAYSSRRCSESCMRLVDRVKTEGGQAIDLMVGNSPSLSDLRAYCRLRAFIMQRSPSVIHAHSSKAGALVRLLPRSGLGQIFYTPHAYYGMGKSGDFKTCIFNATERLLGHRGVSIHVSPEETEFAKKTLGLIHSQMIEIPNAVDFELFEPAKSAEEKADIRRKIGIPEDAAVIGSIGRLGYQKNPELLYHAFSRLVKDNAHLGHIYLLHVGNGTDAEMREMHQLALELSIADQVVRPAYRSDPEVFYRAMDAFCLSSRYEGLPFTGLEALACNLPLILTDAPGLQSFGDPNYGLSHVFYGQANEQSLGDAMEAWLKKRTLPVNHRQSAQKHFSIPEVYGKILQLYEDYSASKA